MLPELNLARVVVAHHVRSDMWAPTQILLCGACAITNQNSDTWTGLQSILGGNVSKRITAATTYTLTCLDLNSSPLTKSATVRILPTFQEL